MDRLSAYAARESETEPPEDRKKSEEEATAKIFENLRVSEERKRATKGDEIETKQANGEPIEGPKAPEQSPGQDEGPKDEPEVPNGVGANEKDTSRRRGIPGNVELYEIFYEQVTHLVNAQRLHIQDTIALLVSLTNLAL